ncbi:ABC transporter permease [Bradyrhizobium sp. DOA9]|uniref:ABC transporter permease n=1 Tax=Bradyrhizobium sp. DOA9 TaxID=1126627 RepID=UPI0004683B57|nr:ABC transporter permease [Bradyrhizobium sp. DOA9]GAJ37603.1 putrescine transport system permease protein potI [Bradyrhizobium sp. DOA9]
MRLDAADRALGVAGLVVRSLVYLMLILPAAIVVAVSFTGDANLSFPPNGLSLRWYFTAIASQPFMSALWTSTHLALIATFLALLIGFCTAYALNRYKLPFRSTLQSIILSPLVIPAVVLGLAILQFLSWLHLNQSYIGLLGGHVLIMLPYVVRTLTTGLELLDPSLEQAALNLRTRPLRVLWRVTIPLLAPSLLTAAVFAFVTSFGNVTLSVFLGYSGATTLPVQIFTYVESSSDPTIAAVSSLVVFVTMITLLIVDRLVGMDRSV